MNATIHRIEGWLAVLIAGEESVRFDPPLVFRISFAILLVSHATEVMRRAFSSLFIGISFAIALQKGRF